MMCATQRMNYNSRAYQRLWAHLSLSKQLTNMLRDLEDTYRDLLTGGKWEGAGNTSTARQDSAFHSVTADPNTLDDFAAYLASAGQLPFNQWVRTQKCHYCSRTRHIQVHCRKMQTDMKNGTFQAPAQLTRQPPLSTDRSPVHQPRTSTTPQPSTHRLTSFRKSMKFQALKAALEDITDSDITPTDKTEHDDQLDNADDTNIDALMCNLGLKD